MRRRSVFYKVEPSDVRHQKGTFEAAFQRHSDQRKILEWKGALTQVGNLSGKHSRTCKDEATMVADIVGNISSRLPKVKPANLINQENLVGMEAHMVNLNLLLNMESENEVLMIGIWGMGGIGKTTIAKCLYDRFSSQFPAHYFIEDIKKVYKNKSPSYLQERFLSNIPSGKKNRFLEGGSNNEIKERLGNKKVFIVLDGVDKAEQIHALAWFGLGSRIIITTRDMGLLTSSRVDNVYEVKCLEDNDALQVFKKSAYGGRAPPFNGFDQLFMRASRLAHGLPSALVAYATYLSESTTIETWEDELRSLEARPHKRVEEILRNSYNDLDELDKTAFLHVACLFNGYPFNHVTSLLDEGRPRMNHLNAKSLISISTDGCINMHFLVEQTAREIVRKESKNRPARQRFIWDPNEIYDVLNNNIGTDQNEGVTLHMCDMLHTLFMSDEVFSNMRFLNFLKFFQHLGDTESKVQFKSDCLQFPVKLKLLHWDAYPLEKLPYSFQHHNLVELNLRYSNLESLWNEAVDQKLWKLRRLDVTGSKNLKKLPDLSTAANFEELIIEGCMRLQNIPESISRSHNLKKLNAINCDLLRGVIFNVDFLKGRRRQRGSWRTMLQFQREIARLDFLTDLSIEGQLDIDLFDLCGSAEHLSFSSKQQIPNQSMAVEENTVMPRLMSDSDSIKSLEIKRLGYIESNAPFSCNSFECFPFLTKLNLINLNIQEIAGDISDLQFLETLDLTGNDFKSLPKTMGQIAKLKYLSLQNCRELRALPQLAQVERLTLSGCVKLRSLKGLLGEERPTRDIQLLELSLENCRSLPSLSLSEELSHFTKLTYLDLSSLEFETIPESIRELPSLGTLCLNNCNHLISLEDLPLSLSYLYAHGCESLVNVSLPPHHSIKHLDLSHCFSLHQAQDLLSQFINQGQNQQVTSLILFFLRSNAKVLMINHIAIRRLNRDLLAYQKPKCPETLRIDP
ncbi:hypothetical protein Bca52824_084194 [Brassica carinata]|uniref:Disease resistance protein n=1 Tax=Brassica carinata TaxID=52824 RepID=A0A8X7PNS3_BRACI|nr:hypothetical protein Bca52824_084194 [Brassica carinata]